MICEKIGAMPTVAELLEQAARAHEAGNLPAVEQLCRQVLQLDPEHADALHRLGLLACQVGKDEIGRAHV